MLEIKDLHVKVKPKDSKESENKILNGVNLSLETGKIHALMGPNGSGKSTLAGVLMGDPKYEIISGEIILDGKNISDLSANERAKAGIFLSFQNPTAIPGVNIRKFLRQAYNSLTESSGKEKLSVLDFNELLEKKADEINLDKDFLGRYLNEGFSGGEKKKLEILQLMVLNPRIAILDETDSGLDIDALKAVSQGINKFKTQSKDSAILIITHYKRILNYVKPDKVSIMSQGKIVRQGNEDLVEILEEKGYEGI